MPENTTTTKGAATPETLAEAIDVNELRRQGQRRREQILLAYIADGIIDRGIEEFESLLHRAGYPLTQAKSQAEKWIKMVAEGIQREEEEIQREEEDF